MNNKVFFKFATGLFLALILILSFNYKTSARYLPGKKVKAPKSHTAFMPPFVVDTTKMFPTSGDCKACHGHDPNGNALIDFFGNDINIHDDWSSSMMALSAKDPWWRAKVSHETHINPQHAEALETICVTCHAPMGHYTAFLRGATSYTIADMLADTTALDGVSCAVCHKISAEDIGNLNSGNINFDTSRVIFGPYPGPFQAPMELYIGFTPEYAPHINDEGLCASCHTLITNSVDMEGELTGLKFIEQATYHEWLNSVYKDNNTTCQACHMPRLEEPVIISSDNKKIEARTPFALHDLVGANAFMLELIKNNRDTLDVSATVEAFDESLAKTYNMLKFQSLDIDLTFEQNLLDTAIFSLELHNKAGHKFPSGYPSRRAFVEFIVLTEEGDTLFASGLQDENYEVIGHDSNYEPHYNVIRHDNQVQIYELVPINVNGDFTTSLERAYLSAKDNRLPPVGFTTDDVVYDTTIIIGNAASDIDFNKDENEMEGTGTDYLHYNVSLNGYTGNINVSARVFYQTLPPRWVKDMFEISTPEIDLFKGMFETADREPIVVADDALTDVYVVGVTAVDELLEGQILVYPNPVSTNIIHLSIPENVTIQQINIFDVNGHLLKTIKGNHQSIEIEGKGLFIIEIETERGIVVRKVVR